jgi:hypothetical protein
VLKIVEKDEEFARLKLADTLADALKRQANGEAAEFNKLLGTADAYATLRGYLKRAATSENPAAKVLAGRHAGVLGLYRKGLQGEYYRGTSFGKRIMVRLDQSIDFPDGDGSQFKLPEGRTEDFSIRWKGQLVVPKDGTYTFVAGSDDGRRVWIDGKQVHSDWTDQGFDSESFEVELSAGLVPIRMEYYQGGGGAGVILKWKTPDMKQAKTIGPEHLRSKLSETEDAQ